MVLVSLLIAAAYLLPTNWHLYPDSITACINVEHGALIDMLHPHHLCLEPLLWICWKVAAIFRSDIPALEVWRDIGMIANLTALWVMFRILQRSGWSMSWSALGILIIASSWYYWLFSVTPSHYSLTVLCLMIIYLKLLECQTAQDVQAQAPMIGMALLIAVLIHQIAILVVVPIVGWVWWLSVRGQVAFAPIPLARPLLLPAIGAYAIGGILATGSLDPFRIFRWLTTYGHYVQYWWWGTLPEGMSPPRYWMQLLASSHRDLFWADPTSAYMRLMCDSERVMRETGPSFQQWWWMHVNPQLASIGNGLLVMLGVWLMIAIVILWKREGEERDRLVLALMWCAPFVGFHALYCVQDGWFRIYYLLPLLWILLAPIATATTPTWRIPSGAIAVCLLTFTLLNNLANGYTLWRHPASNIWLQDLAEVQALDGWLVFAGGGLNYTYTVYTQSFCEQPFYQAELVEASEVPVDALITATALPPRIYIDGRLFNDISEAALATKVLHLGWSNADQAGPKEAWIPLNRLMINRTPLGGRYALLEATVLDAVSDLQ